jgi:hypothetical protein
MVSMVSSLSGVVPAINAGVTRSTVRCTVGNGITL